MQVNELIAGDVVSTEPGASIADAAKLMMSHETGSLAVIDDGELVGIVTERDVMEVVAEDGDPFSTTVDEVMTPNPDALEPDAEVAYAADWVLAAGYRHLPIKDDSGRLIGMLSIKDILWGVTQGRE